LKERITEIYSN